MTYDQAAHRLWIGMVIALMLAFLFGCESNPVEPEPLPEEVCELTHPTGEIVCSPAHPPIQ